MKKMSALIVFMFAALSIFAQDTTQAAAKAGITDVAESDPGLFMVMMFILVGLLGAATAGAFICFFVFTIIIATIATGLLSASVLIGLYHRSVKSAFRTLIYLTFITVGIGGALVAYAIFVAASHQASFSWLYALLIAVPAGGVVGFVCARLFIVMFRRVTALVQKRF